VHECSDGGFRVFEVADLIECMPKKFKPDLSCVKICMDYLQKSGYVFIKYKDAEKYCLMPLPVSYELVESESVKKQKDKKLLKIGILGYILVLFFAFLGSFLANIIFRVNPNL